MAQLNLEEKTEEAEQVQLHELANGEVFKHYGDMFVKTRLTMASLTNCLCVEVGNGSTRGLGDFLQGNGAEIEQADYLLCFNLTACTLKAMHPSLLITPTTEATLNWSTQV